MTVKVEVKMIDENLGLCSEKLLSMEFTPQSAERYETNRFNKGKMLKYDKLEKAFAKRLFQMVGKSSHIVDIPCGSGRFFEIFSKAKKLVMADFSISMLKVCEKRFGCPNNLWLIQADISAMPLEDGFADLCFCMRLFHHMDNDPLRLSALKELARVSRKFVALSFYNHNLRYFKKKLLGKKIRGNHISYKHLVTLAKQAGLKPVGRFPKVNFFTEQCFVIFSKIQA